MFEKNKKTIFVILALMLAGVAVYYFYFKPKSAATPNGKSVNGSGNSAPVETVSDNVSNEPAPVQLPTLTPVVLGNNVVNQSAGLLAGANCTTNPISGKITCN